jgi:hypothetical protein
MALKEKPFSSAADARAQSCTDDHEAEAAGNGVGEEIERGACDRKSDRLWK